MSVSVDGTGLEHRVPSTLQCLQCHESGISPVLGFSELQLNSAAVERGDQLASVADLLSEPPQQAAGVLEPKGRARQVVGYLQGNCAHCHNGGSGPSASFDLRAEVALKNTVGVPTQSSASAPGIRIQPGKPLESVLYLAMSAQGSDDEAKIMPPVGVELADAAFIDELRLFIEELP